MYLNELQYQTMNTNGQVSVEITTSFGAIEIEMAPFHLMPHTTRYFLQMVETGFWKGCHFFRNARHVLQANCHHRTLGRHEFQPTMIFQEYSTAYVHKPFTVGIAGRPGGPDFYINLVDNVENHGPGGQDADADPCFGKIVKGMDVIQHIKTLPRKPDDPMEGLVDEEWVEFLSVTVHVKKD